MITAPSQQGTVTTHFDRIAREYGSKYEGVSVPAHSFRIRRQRVYEMLEGVEGKVLDIGCGPGIMVAWLLSNKLEVYGIDIAEDMIDVCQELFGDKTGAHFSVGAIERLPFDDNFFDAVVCMGVMEYLDDDSAAIAELARVTKSGGSIIITLPSAFSPWRLWGIQIYHRVAKVVRAMIRRPSSYTVIHRSYREGAYKSILQSYSLVPEQVVYYDFQLFPHPLDRFLSAPAVWLAQKLEGLYQGKLRWLATGFIVKATKN